MEQSYWLGRKRDAAANARRTGSSRARLIHLDLAGRYSVMAAHAAAARAAIGTQERAQPSLALPRAGSEPERLEPLGAAGHHSRRRLDAAEYGRL